MAERSGYWEGLLHAQLSRRRGLGVAAGAAAIALLSSCNSTQKSSGSSSQAGSGKQPKKGGTLVLGFESDVGPLKVDGLGGGIVTSRATRHIYEALVDRDYENFHDIPPRRSGLADRWDISPDGLTYTFYLHPGVKFHDGTPFNAAAAKFTLDRLVDSSHPYYYPAAAAVQRASLGSIGEVVAVDDSTLRITLKSLDVEFLYRMEGVYMISPDIIKRYGNDNYQNYSAGTGPFKLLKNEEGVQATFERNSDYWGSSRYDGGPFVDKMVIRFITEPTARVAALKTGEVDWISVVPPDSVASLQQDSQLVVSEQTIPHTWAWILNFRHTSFKDKRVRQAAALAVDRSRMARDLLRGTAEPAYRFWAPGSPGYRPTPKDMTYDYDPQRAKRLLQEAGYGNGLDVKVLTPVSGSGMMEPISMNEFIQQDLAKVGIRVQTETQEWQSFFTKWRAGMPAEYAAFAQAYPTENPTSLARWVSTANEPPNGVNSGWYSNQDVDRLLNEGLRTLDEQKRYDLYQQAIDLLTGDVMVLSVVHDKAPLAWRKAVNGFVHPKSWNFSFFKTWLDT